MASDPRRRVLDALQHGIDERPVLIESLCHDGIRTKIEHQWKRVWWPAEIQSHRGKDRGSKLEPVRWLAVRSGADAPASLAAILEIFLSYMRSLCSICFHETRSRSVARHPARDRRSEEHTSELQSLM